MFYMKNDINSLKEKWTPKLIEVGYDTESIDSMTMSEFYQITNTLIKSGVVPPLRRPLNIKDKKMRVAIECLIYEAHMRMIQERNEEREIKRQQAKAGKETEVEKQNKEFEEALAKHLRNEDEQKKKEEEQKHNENRRVANIQKEKEERKKRIMDEYANLGPEPANGFQIAVQMRSGSRIIRKFTEDMLGKDVYSWISAQDEMFDDESNPIDYELKNVSTVIEKEKTLAEQNIKKRILLTVNIIID